MRRTIVHLDLDSFYVSVERLMDSRLVGKPVIIGGTSAREVVASCSYEARQFGVHSAMPTKLAKQLCPEAIFVRGDMELYAKQSKVVTDIIAERSPVVEKASIDEHYVDITGMDRYVKESKLWTHELRDYIIRQTGLPISFGLSTNKTVSKVATGIAKPNGELAVEAGGERQFMAPLSIKKIPGVGDVTYRLLRGMGIEKAETIQQMPREVLQNVLGENGNMIWRKASGIDPSPVEPYTEQKSLSTETTFDRDTTDVAMLERVLVTMVYDLAYELRKSERVAGCVTLKLRYSDFQTVTFQSQVPDTASDEMLMEKVLGLLRKNYTRRVLVRLIGIRFSQLGGGLTQSDLFRDSEKSMRLYNAMDRIRNRFGSKAIGYAIALDDGIGDLGSRDAGGGAE